MSPSRKKILSLNKLDVKLDDLDALDKLDDLVSIVAVSPPPPEFIDDRIASLLLHNILIMQQK